MSEHSEGLKMPKMNINTILLLISLAAFGWASQLFVTKELYYRDQLKLEQSIKDLNTKIDSSNVQILSAILNNNKPKQ